MKTNLLFVSRNINQQQLNHGGLSYSLEYRRQESSPCCLYSGRFPDKWIENGTESSRICLSQWSLRQGEADRQFPSECAWPWAFESKSNQLSNLGHATLWGCTLLIDQQCATAGRPWFAMVDHPIRRSSPQAKTRGP